MQEPILRIPNEPAARRDAPPLENIPQTRRQRERLLRIVRRTVRAGGAVPPLARNELTLYAEKAVGAAGIDKKYAKFAAVLVSNEVWRTRFAAVPYERRLLLLPQCLRDPRTCPGTLDEYGLLCAGCGRCPIHDLKTEAESLGYAVLTAEGTTVVTALVRSGKIDAIVGVSCLDSLERVHPYIEAAAVPGIAIPLLRDGCANTTVDLDWVYDAMRLSSDHLVQSLDTDALRAEVEGWFTRESLEEVLGPSRSPTGKMALDWLAKSGKRWRPTLTACAFEAFQEDPQADRLENVRKIAVAVECFHKASLVHDDIEDGDAARYGDKTLHERYGVPIALNVGDFLLGEGYRMIAECEMPHDRKAAMLSAAAHGHRSLALGQGAELWWRRSPGPLSPQEVLDIFRRKTAPAFEVALHLGAIHAGADDQVGDVLAEYSESLGIAYQIRDDLKDWRGGTEPDDAAAARPSILLAIAYERARGRNRRLLETVWRQNAPDEATSEALEKLFAELEVQAAARRLLDDYEEKAIRSLEPLTSANLKGMLRRVIFKIFQDNEPGSSARESETPNASRRRTGAGSAA